VGQIALSRVLDHGPPRPALGLGLDQVSSKCPFYWGFAFGMRENDENLLIIDALCRELISEKAMWPSFLGNRVALEVQCTKDEKLQFTGGTQKDANAKQSALVWTLPAMLWPEQQRCHHYDSILFSIILL
jgi:hypothetical protein